MASSITREDAQKIAANLTAQGKDVPAALQSAIDGKAKTRPAPSAPSKGPDPIRTEPPAEPTQDTARPLAKVSRPTISPTPRKIPKRRAARPSVARAQARGRTARRQYVRAGRSLLRSPGSMGGNGGGLLLGIMIYPLVLAIIKSGPAGPGLWMRAKFLNQGTGQPPSATPAPTAAFTLPGHLRVDLPQTAGYTPAAPTTVARAV